MILKILWERLEIVTSPSGVSNEVLVDSHVALIPVLRVDVYGVDDKSPNMEAWDVRSWTSMVSVVSREGCPDASKGSRLISAVLMNGTTEYYEVSRAWLMNDNGDTVQRLAP